MKNKEENHNPKRCPYCQASLKLRWHRVSKGLAESLMLFKRAVIEFDRNKIHLMKDLKLSNNQFGNFNKLRYSGLIAKYINPETKKHESGYWLLTRRGNQFVKNELQIPNSVQTFRNKISDRSDKLVFISEILNDDTVKYWDAKDDFGFEYADIDEMEEIKFDINGQGLLTFKNEAHV